MYEEVTQQLSQAITQSTYSSLSPDAIKKIKLMLLDSIGCALGGYITDRARIAMELIEECGGNPQATIIGGKRTSYPFATFMNSELINALDYDYIGPMTGHLCPYVVPPCLTIAEREHASGKDLILSVALAHEIAGRIMTGLAQHQIPKDEPPYFERSPRVSFSTSIFGSVAGVGRLLGFDAAQMANALGIAGASTAVPAVMKWVNVTGPAIMTKYNAWTGWVAQLATVAALAAEKGFTGDKTILDGEWGYWKIIGSPFFKVDKLFKDLGKIWHIDEVQFKLYPTCYIYHAAIEGIARLVKTHDIKPDDIDQIIIKGDPLMQTPNRTSLEVTSFADAEFFISYAFALAVYHGDTPSPAWQMPSHFNDTRIKALMRKVTLDVHPQHDRFVTSRLKEGKNPVMFSAIVEMVVKGKRFSIEVPEPKGSKGNPATEKDLIEKFRTNASYSMIKTGKIEQVIEMTMHLEDIDDVTKLFALLAL